MKRASKKKAWKETEKADHPPPVKRAPDEYDTAYFIAEATATEPPEPANPPPAETPPAPPPPSQPLTPLAALWPDSVPPQTESNASQEPRAEIQKASGTPRAPKTSSVPASPSFKPPVPPETTALPAQAPKPVNTAFSLVQPGAKRVLLCGDFNGWSTSATPMKRHADGHWEAIVALAPGCYQYKFYVDGEWVVDPSARKTVGNEYGSRNSMIEVRA